MKSLDFINSKIKQINKDLYKLGKTKEGTNKDFVKYDLTEELKNYQDVKQDLEVLKIIKKCRFVGYQKFVGNTVIIDNITDEQYQTIMKWVVEQE